MSGYVIRRVRPEELELFADVIRRSFSTVAEEFGLTVRSAPTNGAFLKAGRLFSDLDRGALLYGLFSGGTPAGFMELEEKDAGVFELKKLSVLPRCRRRGCGGLLLDYARDEVSRMGGRKITIGIIEDNIRLKNWYLKHGFLSVKTARFPHLPFVVGFMELDMDSA